MVNSLGFTNTNNLDVPRKVIGVGKSLVDKDIISDRSMEGPFASKYRNFK